MSERQPEESGSLKPSVFVSSSLLSGKNVQETVEEFRKHGISSIEWSGGHPYTEDQDSHLRSLGSELSIRLHNYFPPPKTPFVLNLSSDNAEIRQQSVAHVKKSIDLSASLDIHRYGVHAGFRFDPPPSRLGLRQVAARLAKRELAVEMFLTEYLRLQEYAEENGVCLYVENNVLSAANRDTFRQEAPFLLLCSEDWLELKRHGVENLLLDVAHLKVTCRSLSLDFGEELGRLWPESDYVHLSSNDGFVDSNESFTESDTEMLPFLADKDFRGKEVTLEIYTNVIEVKESIRLIEKIRNE